MQTGAGGHRFRAIGTSLVALAATWSILWLSACGGASSTALVAPTHAPTATPRPHVTAVADVPLDAALAGKTIYVNTSGRSGTQSAGCLWALNAQTGATRWSFCPMGSAGTPAVVNGVVYVAPEDGSVYALDAGTGKQRWAHQRNDGSARHGFDGYPVVDGSVVYVGSDPGHVFALNTSDGSVKWTFDTQGNPVYSTPAVGDGHVYVSDVGLPGLVALDAASGNQVWTSAKSSLAFGGAPTAQGGVVYAGGSDKYLAAVNGTTGAALWSFQAGDVIIARPAVGGTLVYVGAADQIVYAVDAHSGQLRWKFQTSGNAPKPLIPTGAAPSVAGNVLYVGSQGGTVYALDATSGQQIWSYTGSSGIGSAPTVVDGAVYVTSDDGTISALRGSDGKLSWAFKAGDFSYPSPVVA